jgi:hypothetical protein
LGFHRLSSLKTGQANRTIFKNRQISRWRLSTFRDMTA